MQALPRPQKGFTLLELLLVLVIVGLAASVTIISIGKGFQSENLDKFSKTLRNTLGYAAEEAVLFKKQIGIRFDVENEIDLEEMRYVILFYQLDETAQKWLALDDKDFKKIQFPPGTELMVEIEDEVLTIGGTQEGDVLNTQKKVKKQQKGIKGSEEKSIYPDVIFFSSGETQKFVIKMNNAEKPEQVYEVSATILGQLSVKTPFDEEER